MNYQYDIADFKRYLNDKNPKYRVDGLIFWQNRIPIPIDLFNRIFEDADEIVLDYVYQVVAGVLVFTQRGSFKAAFGVDATDLPNSGLKEKSTLLKVWLHDQTSEKSNAVNLAYEIADIFGLDEFCFSSEQVSTALQHQGKKYSRIFLPTEIRDKIQKFAGCEAIGRDNTDMFGNIIADRYNIYRSGFSDALAIIFNALLDFRILCSLQGDQLTKLRIVHPVAANVDARLGKTSDGSLWEPGYENEHFVTLNIEHPMIRKLSKDQSSSLAELLFFMSEFESSQFSDVSKKLIENLRQSVSRSLWIKCDKT